jgi:hypothetical protein
MHGNYKGHFHFGRKLFRCIVLIFIHFIVPLDCRLLISNPNTLYLFVLGYFGLPHEAEQAKIVGRVNARLQQIYILEVELLSVSKC